MSEFWLRARGRDLELGVVLGGSLRHAAEDRHARDGLNVVHVLDAGNEEHGAAHLGGAADGLVDRLKCGDAADLDRPSHAREEDPRKHGGRHDHQSAWSSSNAGERDTVSGASQSRKAHY